MIASNKHTAMLKHTVYVKWKNEKILKANQERENRQKLSTKELNKTGVKILACTVGDKEIGGAMSSKGRFELRILCLFRVLFKLKSRPKKKKKCIFTLATLENTTLF